MGQGMRVVLIGAGIGLVGALALARVLRNLLFEVAPDGPGHVRVCDPAALRGRPAGVLRPRPACRADRPDGGFAI